MIIIVKRAVGVDLHTNQFVVYYLEDEKGFTKSYSIAEMDEFMKELRPDDILAVEASTNTFDFVRKIKNNVKEVYVVNPIKYGIIHKTNKKTDKIDAKKLAYGAKYHAATGGNHLPLVYVPEKQISELRSLFTTYDLIKKKITMTVNRIHSILKANLFPYNGKNINEKECREEILRLRLPENEKFQIEILYEELDKHLEHKEKFEEKIERFAAPYKEEVKTMISVTGISILCALAIKSDYAELERFPNAKGFTSYLRTAPKIDASRSAIHIGSVNKESRKLALSMLIQGLPHYWNSNEGIKNFRENKIKGKSKGKVRIAIARKLLVCLYFMLKRNELYRYTNQLLYAQKLEKLNEIIDKYK